MLQLGISGNIGSGKSTVCRIFASLGIAIYDADSRAKAIMTEDKSLVEQLCLHFGKEVYFEDGQLNRHLLAQLVFNNQQQLELLNSIVHPAVFADYDRWFKRQTSAYVIKEAALLFESGSYKTLDKVMVVACPEAIRLERAMKRDQASEAEVRARMNKQMPEEEKIKMADFTIYNDGEQLLIPQVMKLHSQFLGKSV